MTSRELTSGFDFWSRGHLCMAVMHLAMKFGVDIFIQSGVIDFFSKIKDGGSRHLGFDWIKILSWLVRYFTSYKDLNFLSFRTVLFTPPKFQFLGDFTPKNLGAHRSDPQKALLWAERRVLSPHWSWSDAQCDLWPWQSNQKKKKKTVANWLFAQTTHLAVSKSKFACRLASGV